MIPTNQFLTKFKSLLTKNPKLTFVIVILTLAVCNKLKRILFTRKNRTSTLFDSETRDQWIPIKPLESTTLPLPQFIVSQILSFSLIPIYLPSYVGVMICRFIMRTYYSLVGFELNMNLTPFPHDGSSYVIVTGAASGIGKEMALNFFARGFSLILIDINPSITEFGQSLEGRSNPDQYILTFEGDLSAVEVVDNIIAKLIETGIASKIVILANNAGFGQAEDFVNQEMKQIQAMIDVNCSAGIRLAHFCCRQFLMHERPRGRILQIASSAGFTPSAYSAVYHSSKAFVRFWARAMQVELMGTGCGVTVACPGPVNTNFFSSQSMDKSPMNGQIPFALCDPHTLACALVQGTLDGETEIVLTPFWKGLTGFTELSDEQFLMMSCKLLWQDPKTPSRRFTDGVDEMFLE